MYNYVSEKQMILLTWGKPKATQERKWTAVKLLGSAMSKINTDVNSDNDLIKVSDVMLIRNGKGEDVRENG